MEGRKSNRAIEGILPPSPEANRIRKIGACGIIAALCAGTYETMREAINYTPGDKMGIILAASATVVAVLGIGAATEKIANRKQ